MVGTYNDDTRPAPLHSTPLHAQNLMSFTQPPASSPAWPCCPASSHIDLNPQNCVASRATGYTAVAFVGTAVRRARHVLQGYPWGSLVALSVNCVMHCWAEAESIIVFVGAPAGGAVGRHLDDECGGGNERPVRTGTIVKRMRRRGK